jgi:hypothetical protein
MKKAVHLFQATVLLSTAYGADDVAGVVHGTVDKIDSTTKTVVVRTADGTTHELHLAEKTTVHGTKVSSEDAAKDSWHGVSKGSEVVVHYSERGTDDTAVEIDRVGKDGLKVTKGTVEDIDRGGKKLVVDTGDGANKPSA